MKKYSIYQLYLSGVISENQYQEASETAAPPTVELAKEESEILKLTQLKGAENRGNGIWFIPDKLVTPIRLSKMRTEREQKYWDTPRGGRNIEMKNWADVVGDPYARGYAVLDRRGRNAERSTPTPTTPSK